MRLRETIEAIRALNRLKMRDTWPLPGTGASASAYSAHLGLKFMRETCGRCGKVLDRHRWRRWHMGNRRWAYSVGGMEGAHTFVPIWAMLLDVPHRR